MTSFDYKAKDINGKNKSGTINAESINEFYAKLREQNLFCISYTEKEEHSGNAINVFGSPKLKLQDVSIFCRQFATMMNAGLTVVKCLDILYRQSENKRIKTIMLELYELIKKGNSLSFALKEQGKTFPTLLISMVESGEASGTLDDVMLSMSAHYEKERILKNKVKSAMIYPIILLIVSVGVVIILLTFVMPTFFEMFDSEADLPGITRGLISLSGAMTEYWYIFVLGAVAIAIACYLLLKIEVVKLFVDTLKTKFPIFGKLLIIVSTARFSRTVSSLYSGGVPIVEAIRIASNVMGNLFISSKLLTVIDDIKQGITFSKALTSANIFPMMFSSMVFIGEESGSLDEILDKTANFYDEESSAAITKMVALLEPCMIVILAVIIGVVVVAIALPMFTMYSTIS